MTFTEAALEVLRSAGKPLHYKKITEIAIERNLLSHVGKTPEVTMSARLATMVKRDRGSAPIIKVRPGVFAVRAMGDQSGGSKAVNPIQQGESMGRSSVNGPDNDSAPERAAPDSVQPLPGADLFPEEEDDNDLILASLESDEPSEEENKSHRRRRRRRRSGKGEADNGVENGDSFQSPSEMPRRRLDRAERSASGRRFDEDRDQAGYRRPLADGSLLGKDLADAVWTVLSRQEKYPVTFPRAAELLVRRGRLAGNPASLSPTVAAAVRADISRAELSGSRPRFRVRGNRVGLTDWLLPREVVRAEEMAARAAEQERDQVRRSLIRKLQELPTQSFAELIAAWLNAEGVVALRAIRRTGGSGGQLCFAGTLKRGVEETRLAIIAMRDGRVIDRERVIEARGALHHYGNATAAWMVTTGRVVSGAREESAAPGAPQCTLFDDIALAEAMERLGIGIKKHQIPITSIDFDLFEALGERGEFRDRERDRDRGERDWGYNRGRRANRERDRVEREYGETEAQEAPAQEEISAAVSKPAESLEPPAEYASADIDGEEQSIAEESELGAEEDLEDLESYADDVDEFEGGESSEETDGSDRSPRDEESGLADEDASRGSVLRQSEDSAPQLAFDLEPKPSSPADFREVAAQETASSSDEEK